jgi:ribosomal protein S30
MLCIKLSIKVKIILLRKYNVIFNVKDAGVNQKRKSLFCCNAKTNKATKRLQNRKKYETIVEEIRLQLTQVM